MLDSINSLMVLMSTGRFEEASLKAQQLLKLNPPVLEKAACHYTIGCAKGELGEKEAALPFLLEALELFPSTETLLIGHTQDELARIQFKLKFYTSALFFIEMAISNFELGGNAEMKASCDDLREEILRHA
jgi:tetratricopeptide (TPR) repeat protein